MILRATTDYERFVMGDLGFRVLTGASAAGETFRKIVPLGASATVTATCETGDGLTTESIDKEIVGRFTSITVTSGKVIAYLG